MSWTQTFHLPFSVQHSVEESGLDISNEQILASMKAQVASFESNPEEMRKALFSTHRDADFEDAWILRSAYTKNTIFRSGEVCTISSRRDLKPEDIMSQEQARSSFSPDRDKILTRVDDLDINLVIADVFSDELEFKGLLDLRPWISHAEIEDVKDFVENPENPDIARKIIVHAAGTNYPGARLMSLQSDLTVLIRDPDFAVDIACELRGLVSDFGIEP